MRRPTPNIKTERLQIVEFYQYYDEAAMNNWVRWVNDPETTKYMRHANQEHTRESCAGYGKATCEAGNWFLQILLGGNVYIGNMTVVFDDLNSRADMSILIGTDWKGRPWRGSGFGTEAWHAVMGDLFAVGIHKVTCGTVITNLPMRTLAQKTGMAEDGQRKAHDMRDGQMTDVIHYAKWRT